MSIPPVLTEAVPPRNPTAKSEKSRSRGTIASSKILETIEQHVLLDGFKIVVDLDKSRGSYLSNAVDDRRLIDLYGFFGSMPVGFNHPHFDEPTSNAIFCALRKLRSRTRMFTLPATRNL